eukprot:gnl/Dysnectes_brevis/8973_a16358_177.p1 GENE.gnl/Dysnectes_brevis/8973_a16358_177~~gnl/Dysnectes_brevis/8973_a16358_177.p1  ORF type:complete len:273 (+),score=58.39 gnl/Dysnectes_brevis/8973_a16358_177:71-820(+)
MRKVDLKLLEGIFHMLTDVLRVDPSQSKINNDDTLRIIIGQITDILFHFPSIPTASACIRLFKALIPFMKAKWSTFWSPLFRRESVIHFNYCPRHHSLKAKHRRNADSIFGDPVPSRPFSPDLHLMGTLAYTSGELEHREGFSVDPWGGVTPLKQRRIPAIAVAPILEFYTLLFRHTSYPIAVVDSWRRGQEHKILDPKRRCEATSISMSVPALVMRSARVTPGRHVDLAGSWRARWRLASDMLFFGSG